MTDQQELRQVWMLKLSFVLLCWSGRRGDAYFEAAVGFIPPCICEHNGDRGPDLL